MLPVESSDAAGLTLCGGGGGNCGNCGKSAGSYWKAFVGGGRLNQFEAIVDRKIKKKSGISLDTNLLPNLQNIKVF